MKSILVVGKGDTPYSDRNRARFVDYARKAGHEVLASDYHEIRGLGGFSNGRINVLFFFPYTFWNANCEKPTDTNLYGTSRDAYEMFRRHFLETGAEIAEKFKGHEIHYVIPPQAAPVDRDKIETVARLKARGVPTPQQLPYISANDVISEVTKERGVFIKCRYGSEGKGITVLHKGRWVTNYKVEGDSLSNYGVYEKWQFADITGRAELVTQLLRHEVIVEQEIITPDYYNGMKFDLRAYVVMDKVPHFFVRLNEPKNEITNFSQGAKIRHHPETGMAEEIAGLAKRTAIKAANALGLEFVGVDLMFDGGMENPKVVEAQAFTDFPDIDKLNLAKYMLDDKSGLFKE
ncbi:MAG: YheC/YheD family protein [Candidatus Micrarchaeia archaeon]